MPQALLHVSVCYCCYYLSSSGSTDVVVASLTELGPAILTHCHTLPVLFYEIYCCYMPQLPKLDRATGAYIPGAFGNRYYGFPAGKTRAH